MKMENNELKSKLEKFMVAKIPIHIVLKKREENNLPRFLNGMIVEKKTEDIFVMDERKIGTTYVFVEDIYDISVFVKDNRTLAEDIVRENGFKMGEGVSKDEIDLIKDI
jgi:hypothetical protein